MNLIDQINLIIKEYNDSWDLSDDGTMHQYRPVEHWLWSSGNHLDPDPVLRRINYLIELAPTNECLTSPSEYIRELKRWLLT